MYRQKFSRMRCVTSQTYGNDITETWSGDISDSFWQIGGNIGIGVNSIYSHPSQYSYSLLMRTLFWTKLKEGRSDDDFSLVPVSTICPVPSAHLRLGYMHRLAHPQYFLKLFRQVLLMLLPRSNFSLLLLANSLLFSSWAAWLLTSATLLTA